MEKILFHGTNNKDDILLNGLNESQGLYGDGFYFYENSKGAKTYGKQIVKARVRILKPFLYKSESEKKLYHKIYGKDGSHRKAINILKSKGYDSFRFKDFSKNSFGYWAWNIFYSQNILQLN